MTDAVPAGRYLADATHTGVTFGIKHLGLAWSTGRFARMAATLDFNPDEPERMLLEASVELASVRTDYEGPAGDWDGALATREDLLDAARRPVASVVSHAVRRTGEMTADVEGELVFRGHTRPLVFGHTYFLGPLLPDEVQLIIETELALEA